jgi:hypothetical protein
MLNKIIFLLVIISGYLALEVYLNKTRVKPENAKPPLAVCTHSGERISEDGMVTLALSPYTIYKNLPNQKNNALTINSLGFRGCEVSKQPNNRMRIIIVGGSGAFGQGVENDNDTFQVLLEKLNTTVEVINAGVAGFLSGQELTYIVSELVNYHPNLIIAYNGWNDLQESWYHKTWWNKQKAKDEMGYNTNFFIFNIENNLVSNYQTQVSIFKSFSRFFNTLVDKSTLISLLRNKMMKIKQQKIADTQPGVSATMLDSDYMTAIIETYVNNIIKMDKFCKSMGIKFMLVFQPELGLKTNKSSVERALLATWTFGSNNYANEFPLLYRTFIDRSKKLLIKNGVDYLDINAIPEFTNSKDTLFNDVVHTNKLGNEIIAKIINEVLSRPIPMKGSDLQ